MKTKVTFGLLESLDQRFSWKGANELQNGLKLPERQKIKQEYAHILKRSLCLLLFMLNIEDFHVEKISKLNIEKNFICSFTCFVRSSYPMFREMSGSTFKQEEWTSICKTCKCYIIKVWEFSLVQCPSAA